MNVVNYDILSMTLDGHKIAAKMSDLSHNQHCVASVH